MPKDYVKKNPRILNKDVYDYIATHSSLTREQAKECFEVYSEMIEKLSLSKYILDETTISFPKIGYFYFKRRLGRKKGSSYIMPITSKEKGVVKTVYLEEDEPTTYKLSFKVSPKLHKETRSKRKEQKDE